MHTIQAYIKGWQWSLKNVKIWLWLYLCNFALAAIVAIPLMNLLEEKLGHSMVSDQLMAGFDYTIFTDFMNEYGVAISPILSQSRLVILLYFLLSIWLMGGILTSLKNSPQKAKFQLFTTGSIQFFWRILRMTLYFLILHGLLAFLFFQLFNYSVHEFDFKQLESELEIYSSALLWGSIYSLSLMIVFLIQDYAKIFLVHNDSRVHKAILKSLKLVFRNFGSTFFLSLLNWLTFGLIFYIYWILRGGDLNSTVGSLWLTFILGQIFIFLRIGLKVVNLESATVLYRKINKI